MALYNEAGQASSQVQTGQMDEAGTRRPFVIISRKPWKVSSRRSVFLLGLATIVSLWCIDNFALYYLTTASERFGIYRDRHQWLLAHVAGGIVALMLGPPQLWLGSHHRHMLLHRFLGVGYVMSVGTSCTAAFYLAFKTDFGWVLGIGLTGMATAWMISTTFAVAAICMGNAEQHREWMIRSCVVTFGFVFYRFLAGAFELARIGNLTEQLTAASWLSWSIPLVITEAFIQGRKILSR